MQTLIIISIAFKLYFKRKAMSDDLMNIFNFD